MDEATTGINRRKFLKILGAGSAVAGLSACADSPKQTILPLVKGDTHKIPGVAVWYSSTCTECSAGCGIKVRTREGRSVKVEGNKLNPINTGSLCALGQASLQSLYDPDRIRQPLERVTDGSGKAIFRPIAWDAAMGRIAEALKKAKGKKAFISGELSGAISELLAEWSSAAKFERVTYDLTQPVALAKASELVYGSYGVPQFHFERAEVVLNFGADFLETWISPTTFARDWAEGRRNKKAMLKHIQVEPRLSLTGSNADLWLNAKPGTEVEVALAILKSLLDEGKGKNLNPETLARIGALVKKVDLDKVARRSGVAKAKLVLVAHYLEEAKSSLIIAGGSSASTNEPLALQVVCGFMNLVLGNVGNTINLNVMRKPATSLNALQKLISAMGKGEYEVLFVHGANPAFALPSSLPFKYARKTVSLMVSFSSHLDETTELADLILPSHTSLEDWGDVRVLPGVYGLVQPTMLPVFDTRGFGDSLLQLADKAGFSSIGGGKKEYSEYLKASWQNLYQELGAESSAMGNFEKFWLKALEQGGFYSARAEEASARVKVSPAAFELDFKPAEFDTKNVTSSDPVLFPYVSVKSFDGRAANRPWLQELPDPVTKIVWDTWAEIHPDTARKLGIAQGDMLTVRNFYGELNIPAYLTEYVHTDIVAVPVGQGHGNYGRYARKVSGGNVLELLPPKFSKQADGVALLSTHVLVSRGRSRAQLVNAQGSDSQMGRDLAKTKFVGAGLPVAHGHDDHAHGHGDHHEPLQMYEQREHPLYRWGMNVDLASCTGCSACVVACYAENNIPVVGKKIFDEGREMSWLRIERYYEGPAEELQVSFLPMMCQHCGNAPCEPVCPVYATYHNEEGLNAMIYNRCVGTRYCSNNCSYKVRRFNWHGYEFPEPLNWQLNPDVQKRGSGVMEKCSFCVQRIVEAKDHAKDQGRMVQDGEIVPACVQTCPTGALTFGNLNDPESKVSKLSKDKRAYKVLDHHLNTQPAVSYLSRIKYKM